METRRKDTGRIGETLAADYLEGLGHKVIERNWRSGHLETDIITIDKNGLHFVEVKTRIAPAAADPLENITRSKKRNMANAARHYLQEHSCGDMEIFLDVVTVLLDGECADIEYYPQAVIPIYN